MKQPSLSQINGKAVSGGTVLDTRAGDKKPSILITGGGSGGHITPLLAVAKQIKLTDDSARVISVGERGSKFGHLTNESSSIDKTFAIFAGKFRRYHGETFLRQLLDIKTVLLNVRDAFYVFAGFFQAIIILITEKPDVVFLKGGFVGVPVGLAAAILRKPIITHDSDALPGLANKIVSRWVTIHATGMPAEYYPYNRKKTRHVGVLVGDAYSAITAAQKKTFKHELQLPDDAKVLFITGGSLGSQRVNKAAVSFIPELLSQYEDLYVLHQVGKGNTGEYKGFTHPRLIIEEFLSGMHRYSGAADLIVTRAGANTIAEFGVQGKACVIVPSPFLAGGHQLKNAQYLHDKQAAVIVDEVAMVKNPEILKQEIETLLSDESLRTGYEKRLQSGTVTDATKRLTDILMQLAKK